MRLHTIDVGAGPKTALLLHGMLGSAESWAAVTRILVDRGHRVLAVDLPGHGLSPRDPDSSTASAADAVVEAVRSLDAGPLSVAMGHSYGGTVLALAAERLSPEQTVYVDTGFPLRGGHDQRELAEQYRRDQHVRTAEWLRENRAYCTEEEILAEARAAERVDPDTAAAVSAGAGVRWSPRPGDLVVRADPSRWVSDAEAADLRARGVQVRNVSGAAHTVWYSHPREFVDALPEVFGSGIVSPPTT